MPYLYRGLGSVVSAQLPEGTLPQQTGVEMVETVDDVMKRCRAQGGVAVIQEMDGILYLRCRPIVPSTPSSPGMVSMSSTLEPGTTKTGAQTPENRLDPGTGGQQSGGSSSDFAAVCKAAGGTLGTESDGTLSCTLAGGVKVREDQMKAPASSPSSSPSAPAKESSPWPLIGLFAGGLYLLTR